MAKHANKTLTEHGQRFKAIVYTLTEPLSIVFTQIEDLRMLEKSAKNPYSDRQIFEIDINITRNTNYFEIGQADWYEKIPGKQT